METLGAGNKRIKTLMGYMRSASKRRDAGIFISEGIRMFREAPGELILEVYMTKEACDSCIASSGDESLKERIFGRQSDIFIVSTDLFGKISDTVTPQGILTVMKRREYGLEDLLNAGGEDAGKGEKKPLLMILENLQDPGNLGTILRVSEAAGVTGIIMNRGCVDIYNPKVVRSTMGSIFRMPFMITDDLAETVDRLAGAGIETYAAHLQGSEVYTDYDYTGPCAFFIGNEGNGLSEEITAKADHRLFIPMEGSIESLNAGIAAAVLSYEAHRQRTLN